MRRVVGLIAFCGMVLSTNCVPNAEAAGSHNQIKKKVKQSSKVQKQKKKTTKKNSGKSKKQSKKVSKKKKKAKTVAISSKTTSQDDFVVINEPVIDGSKINKSSMVVDEDIELANNDEIDKVENIKLASNSEVSEADITNVLSPN